MTRLDEFRIANGIKPVQLAQAAGVSRAHLARLRAGHMEPTRPTMLAIRDACSLILRRQVHLAEVFNLGDQVAIVTREHGLTFVGEWFQRTVDGGAHWEAFDLTDILEWPAHDERGQATYSDIQTEICQRVLDEVRDAVCEAFVRVTNDVLARERSR